jgi:hypothetical protein
MAKQAPKIKWRLQPSDFEQVVYMVTWARPELTGGIAYHRMGEDQGCAYDSRQVALRELKREQQREHPEAYLVRITYQREDLIGKKGV